MIQGYRMAGPPPHGEPPPGPPAKPDWPWWLGFAALLVVAVISLISASIVYGIAGTTGEQDAPPAADLIASLALQASLVAVALGATRLYKPLRAGDFGLRPTRWLTAVGWAALGLVVFYLVAALWVALIGEPNQSTAEDIGADQSQLALICAGVLFVFIAPVAEEFFFRGFFYGTLRTRLPTIFAALVCGVVFGVIHASTGISAVPILMVLGLIFCLVREKTGSLYPCIAMHAVNNTFAYAGQTDVAPGIAAGFGVTMLVLCFLVPRFAWRRQPSPA